MGVERFLVSSTVHGVLAQRLVRKLCTHCKALSRIAASDLPADYPKIEESADSTCSLYQAVGCRQCNQTGFRGRIGIFELLQSTAEIRRLVSSGASHDALRQAALAQGMLTLRQSVGSVF